MGSRTNETMGLCLVAGHLFNQINARVAVEACTQFFTWVKILTERSRVLRAPKACCLTEVFPKFFAKLPLFESFCIYDRARLCCSFSLRELFI